MAANSGKAEDGAVCRICFLGDEENSLIRVCQCKGSLEFVHHNCISQWVNTSRIVDCICGYRLNVRQEKMIIEVTLNENGERSWRGFAAEDLQGALTAWNVAKNTCYLMFVLYVAVILFLMFDLATVINEMLSGFWGSPYFVFQFVIKFLSMNLFFLFIIKKLMRTHGNILEEILLNRYMYKLTVRPIELMNKILYFQLTRYCVST